MLHPLGYSCLLTFYKSCYFYKSTGCNFKCLHVFRESSKVSLVNLYMQLTKRSWCLYCLLLMLFYLPLLRNFTFNMAAFWPLRGAFLALLVAFSSQLILGKSTEGKLQIMHGCHVWLGPQVKRSLGGGVYLPFSGRACQYMNTIWPLHPPPPN